MAHVKDKLGKRFGKLVVVNHAGRDFANRVLWECLCDCGKKKTVVSANLGRRTNSCGCIHGNNRTHGMSKTKTYKSWCLMRDRCTRKNSSIYKYYGGRGIKFCKRWNNFSKFLFDMGERPHGCTLDRINNSKGYSKNNCRWADGYTQARNKRNNRIIKYRGESRPMTEWASIYSIKVGTLWARLNRGWSVEDCLSKNVRSMEASNRTIDRSNQ